MNAPFPTGFGDGEYLSVYDRILKPIALEYQPELVLVSAGFDPYFADPLGGMQVTAEGFGALAGLVKDIADRTCSGKVLLTLEGGYNPQGLRDGVRAVILALQSSEPLTAQVHSTPAAEQVIEKIILVQKKYWKNLR